MLVCFSVLGILTNVMPLVGTEKRFMAQIWKQKRFLLAILIMSLPIQWEFLYSDTVTAAFYLALDCAKEAANNAFVLSFPVFLQILSRWKMLYIYFLKEVDNAGLTLCKYGIITPSGFIFWGFGFYGFI